MLAYINQYKALFFLTWVLLFLIIPTWTLPVSVYIRAAVYFGLLVYFCISVILMNRWFSALTVDKPVFAWMTNWRDEIINNIWLVVVCCIAVLLHLYPLLRPILIIGDEALHLQNGLWIYEYIDSSWHNIFQVIVWIIIALLLIIKTLTRKLNVCLLGLSDNKLFRNISFSMFFVLLVAYFLLLKDVQYVSNLTRYPPFSKVIYFLTYSAFGVNHIFARIIQLCFYLLCTVYLYRTINLFYKKETALLGAAIYLFLPISFLYARLGELASGTIFFIVVISFYFIRYIKDGDNRDLLLATYLIGTGFLYKKPILLMFIICFTFLIAHKIKNHNFHSLIYPKVLSLSLVPIVPWMIITKIYSWRNYTFQLSNLTSLDAKIVTYFSMMSLNLSEIVSVLFVLSVFYICFYKRNTLTIFFGLLFVVYYFFIVSDIGNLSPRFSMVFYPTIVVFLSIFISRVFQYIKWRHAFKLFFIFFTIYLVTISAVAPFNKRFLTIMDRKLMKLLYFPSDKVMKWVKDNVHDGEKVITVRIMSANFYRVKYGIDKDKIVNFWYEIKDISTPEKLKSFYKKNDVSYIIFPHSPDYLNIGSDLLEYLKDNPDKEFIEVAKFNLDDNFIYIYELKEN